MKNYSNYLNKDEKVVLEFTTAKKWGLLKMTFFVIAAMPVAFMGSGLAWLIICTSLIYYMFFYTNNFVYLLTEKRLITITGYLTKNVSSIPYSKITDIKINMGLLGYGDIYINTAGGGKFETVLETVDSPNKIRNKIEDLRDS